MGLVEHLALFKWLWEKCWSLKSYQKPTDRRGWNFHDKFDKLWSGQKYRRIAPILTILGPFESSRRDLSFETHFGFSIFFSRGRSARRFFFVWEVGTSTLKTPSWLANQTPSWLANQTPSWLANQTPINLRKTLHSSRWVICFTYFWWKIPSGNVGYFN